jgi:hypothetical protein
MTGATLFRRNGPAWRFERPDGSVALQHVTRCGTVYRIYSDDWRIPMIWIASRAEGPNVDKTASIGAEYIQFDNGSEFWFRRPKE